MSLNIKTDDGYISVAGGSVEPLKYTAITGAGVTVNNDPESTGYRTIENTGVHSIETGTTKDNANGTILVQTGVASATNPAVAVAVKGLNNAAYKDVDTTVDGTTKTSTKLPTTKAVYDTLKKIEDGVFQRDTDAVSVKTVPSGVKNYAVVEKIYGKTVKSKNLFPNTSQTYGKASLTTRSDGGIDIKTTEATSVYMAYTETNVTLKTGTYVLYDKGAYSDTAMAIVMKPSDGSRLATYEGTAVEFTISSDTVVSFCYRLNSTSAFTKVAYPVLVLKSENTNDFVPYGLLNAPIESVVSNPKNVLNTTFVSGTTSNLTVTKTGINSYNINGTVESGKYPEFILQEITLDAGTYYVSLDKYASPYIFVWVGTKDGASTDKYKYFNKSMDGYGTFTLDKRTTVYVRFVGSSAKVFNNFNVKICISTIYTTYQDHTIGYDVNEIELSEAIKSLPDFGCSCPSADGTGTVYNWIDFENGVYHHCVGSSYLSSGWGYNEGGAYFYNSLLSSSKKAGEMNIIHAKYNTVLAAAAEMPDKSIKGASTSANIFLKDTSCGTSTENLVKALGNTKCYYELAQEELKDISDIIRPIKCETGGTITLKNEHNLDVANTIIYEKEVLA